MDIDFLKKHLTSGFITIILTAIAFSDALYPTANRIADLLYQRPTTPDERIVIIGIDERSIKEYGPFPWERKVIASALEFLNADPNNKPAVIGIDIILASESNEENDTYLIETIKDSNNIILSSFATFGSEIINLPNGRFYTNDYAILDFTEPFQALKEVSVHGHVNAMMDMDGVLRHLIWEIKLPNGEIIPSFHQMVANKYQEVTNNPPVKKPPTDARERWYVLQQTKSEGYSDGFSLVDVVDKNLDPTFFKDKIVLIGPYTSGLQDEYKTAIDHSKNMYGVEYLANSISALLNDQTKTEVSLYYQKLFLGFVIFCFFMYSYSQNVKKITFVWAVSILVWINLCYFIFQKGYLLAVFQLPFALTVLYIIAIAINYRRADLEKKDIANMFQRYVSPEIVDEILKSRNKGLELNGKLVEIAVLFVDIRGFTSLSEKLEPHKVVEIINKFLTLTSDCIFQYKGTLDKFIGDCTMAFFGAPIVKEDFLFDSIKAASAIIEGQKQLTEEIYNEYGYYIGMGVGINFGPAVVGNIGSSVHMDYTAIGDTVNTASRLEGMAKAGQILLSAEVVKHLQGRIEVKSIGTHIKLKGKEEEIEVFELVKIIDKEEQNPEALL